MRPLYDFHIKIKNLFEKEIVVGGVVLHKDTRFDDFDGRISHTEIVGVPEKFGTVAEIGDTLIFHHHINQEIDKYTVSEGVARVSYDPENYQGQSYAVIKPDGSVHMLGNWVFLRAESQKKEDNITAAGLFIGRISKEDRQEAEVYCEGLGTEEIGIKKGDVVHYTKNSDYRVKLPSGDEVYRCKPSDIVYVKIA